MPLRITINENNIKCLCALVAIERLFYGKNPFHLGPDEQEALNQLEALLLRFRDEEGGAQGN
jgi:hypothetical protein